MKKLKNIFLAGLLSLFALPGYATPTDITPKTPPALTSAITATSADFTWTAADTSNGNSVTLTGNELLLVNNTGGSAYTVTVSSVADDLGRTGDISAYSVGAGLYSVLGPFPLRGWRQSATGKLNFSASNAAVKFAVVKVQQ